MFSSAAISIASMSSLVSVVGELAGLFLRHARVEQRDYQGSRSGRM
jgi:hypothetical protein